MGDMILRTKNFFLYWGLIDTYFVSTNLSIAGSMTMMSAKIFESFYRKFLFTIDRLVETK